MPVVRVSTPSGSRIQPPLDESWSPLKKLSWAAGVAKYDGDIYLVVTEHEPGRFDVSWRTPAGGGTMGAQSFAHAWFAMAQMARGAQIRREMDDKWRQEALEVMTGLQELGEALGLEPGTRITGGTAAEKARQLRARAERLDNLTPAEKEELGHSLCRQAAEETD